MATVASEMKTLERGGFPAIGPKIGYIENTVTLTEGASADDRISVFTFDAATVVLSCGSEIVTAAANDTTASIGVDGDSAASCTSLAGEIVDCDGAVGVQAISALTTNVLLPAAEVMQLELSGDPGAGGTVRVWALVADINDVSGV